MTDKRKTPDVVDATEAYRQSRAAVPNDLGRAFALEEMPEDHLRMIEKAAADLSFETPSETARKAILTVEIDDATTAAIAATKMDPRHDHLNALLGAEQNSETDAFTGFLREFGLEHLDADSRIALRRHFAELDCRYGDQFLAWLAEDIQRRPEKLVSLSPELRERIAALTEGVTVDLDAPIDAEPNVETWLRQEVAASCDAMKADPSRGRSIADVRASLAAELARQGGPNRHAMSKEEIDAMWGHGDEPNAETIAAMNEARRGGLKSFSSIGDLMTDLNDDNAAGDDSETGPPKPD